MQFVAFDVGNDFAVQADLVQVSAAVVQVIDRAAVGQDGADAVAQRVVSVAYGGALAVVDGGFADEAVEFVVGEFDAAVLVAGFGQVAGNGVVFETGAADAFVFALSVAAGDFAALFFDQLAEDVAFEMMDVPSFGTVFQTTFIGALTVFGLLNQLSGGIVAVGGNFAVPADQYEIVKEQMVQTTSKKVLRSSEKQKPRAYVPLVLYIRIKGFVQATASCGCYLFFRRPYGLVSRTDHSFTDKANLRPHHNFHLRFY